MCVKNLNDFGYGSNNFVNWNCVICSVINVFFNC